MSIVRRSSAICTLNYYVVLFFKTVWTPRLFSVCRQSIMDLYCLYILFYCDLWIYFLNHEIFTNSLHAFVRHVWGRGNNLSTSTHKMLIENINIKCSKYIPSRISWLLCPLPPGAFSENPCKYRTNLFWKLRFDLSILLSSAINNVSAVFGFDLKILCNLRIVIK